MVYNLFYCPAIGAAFTSDQMLSLFGIDTATIDITVLNTRGFYPVNETPITADTGLYTAAPSYTVVGQYADQTWTYTARPLDDAKVYATSELKATSKQEVENINAEYGLNAFSFAGIASQSVTPTRYQAVLDSVTTITDSLDSNLTAVEAATTVDEINNVVNKPTGLLFTGRGAGIGPEDLNVSYYNAFNSVSMTEAETELYIPGTATTIAYGSGGPGQFDSFGNCFNPGDYLMQIRETATSMVIAEFECPLNPAGEDVAF